MNCPICKKPTDTQYRPFCSRRCADVDLGRWFNESYTIPQDLTEVDPADDADDYRPQPSPPKTN